jgi:hypothetical protein
MVRRDHTTLAGEGEQGMRCKARWGNPGGGQAGGQQYWQGHVLLT